MAPADAARQPALEPTEPAPRPRAVVISCEHAVREIPPEVAAQIAIPHRVLTSHRGYDRGAMEIAMALAEQMRSPLFLGTLTRLVVDLNRSEGTGDLFSRYGRSLDGSSREQLLRQHYRSFRDQVRAEIERRLSQGLHVLHLSVHTFTPRFRGERRTADIGLLFDPARDAENHFAEAWREAILQHWPQLIVKMNYPYLGTDDGHTTALRTDFPDPQYLGIELEVNQSWPRGSGRRFDRLLQTLRQSLAAATDQ